MHVPCHQRFKAIKSSLLSRTCRIVDVIFVYLFLFFWQNDYSYLDGKKSSNIYRDLCSYIQLTPVVFWRKKSKMGDVTASTQTHTHPRFFRALSEASLLRFYFEVTTLASIVHRVEDVGTARTPWLKICCCLYILAARSPRRLWSASSSRLEEEDDDEAVALKTSFVAVFEAVEAGCTILQVVWWLLWQKWTCESTMFIDLRAWPQR